MKDTTPFFTSDDLLACYRHGVFPMADSREDERIFLIDPERRGLLPIDGFHVPRRLARAVRADPYQIRVDTAFEWLVRECATLRQGRTDTWINPPIEALYRELFLAGHAHSVECWQGDRLVGGLYGVSVGAAFFGESMFSGARDASKVALVHLIARLRIGGYRLLDAQFMTDHLAQFGAHEVTRAAYRRRLAAAMTREGDFHRLPTAATGSDALTAIAAT